jgi:hypothetical protein
MVYSGSFLGRLLFPRIELPVSRTFGPPEVWEMSLMMKEHNVDASAKGAASFFMACSGNPSTAMKILPAAAMRAKGYSDTKAIDQALQMQVRWEVEKLKGGVSAAAPAALSAAAVIVTLSPTVTTRALALIPPEIVNSTLPLDLPLPPRTMHRTSQGETLLLMIVQISR